MAGSAQEHLPQLPIFFTATGTQSLKAVGVETQNPNINYTVNIYTDIANSSNPESGTLVRTQTGSFTYQGVPYN